MGIASKRSTTPVRGAILPHCWNDKAVRTIVRTIRPASGDGLDLGPELNAFRAVLVGIAKGRTLPSAKAVIGDWNRNWHVDTNHPDIDARRKFTRSVAVAGE